MLTQNAPVGAISGQLLEESPGRKPTIAGSNDTEVNDPIVSPPGSPCGVSPVTMVTPVGK